MRYERIAVLVFLLMAAFAPAPATGKGFRNPLDIAPRKGWYHPGVNTTWQWQLNGALNSGYKVDVYIIDLFDTSATAIARLHATNRKVICYFSAGTYENWRPDSGRYLNSELGKTLDSYPNERWLDIRSTNLRGIVFKRLDFAAKKGCDGVEPDNVDGYSNDTGFPLTAQDQLDFNIMLANAAHTRGLAVALKNDLDQVGDLLPYFDFAINESCHRYDECDVLMPFVASGKPVFNAEYEKKYVTSLHEREALCKDARARHFHTLVLPVELNDSFRYSCD